MICDSGYMFSSDLYATMENYSNEVANRVIEKAKNKCRDVLQEQDVSVDNIVLFVTLCEGSQYHVACVFELFFLFWNRLRWRRE